MRTVHGFIWQKEIHYFVPIPQVGGGFNLNYVPTSTPYPFVIGHDTASTIQTELQTISGLENVLVSDYYTPTRL